uniref:SFRICE_023977 n=1 Tax=Spodoptera frugiperda TaxID=7108 RepID=A0A2H1W387_SPOFR
MTASQKEETASQSPSLRTIACTNAGRERSPSPTTSLRTRRCSAHAGHSATLPFRHETAPDLVPPRTNMAGSGVSPRRHASAHKQKTRQTSNLRSHGWTCSNMFTWTHRPGILDVFIELCVYET